MNLNEQDLEALKNLESPKDIMIAALDTSRATEGKTVLKLQSTKDPGYEIWFHPLTAQQEADNQRVTEI